MAFGTLFYAAAAVVQIHLLDRSSEESSLQTDQLIIAAKINALATKDNAAAAQSFAASAQKINEGIGDAVIKLQAQADAMETARRSTDTGAQNALQAAIDNFHQEQRAWVGIDIIPAPIDPKAGGIINQASVTVVAHNSGRTPALGVNISWEMAEDSYGFTDEVPDYDEMMAAKKAARDAMFAQAWESRIARDPANAARLRKEYEAQLDYRSKWEEKEDELNERREVIPPDGTRVINSFWEGNQAGKKLHHLVGRIKYYDVFDPTRGHVTKFCLVRYSDGPFQLCLHGQDMN
jgi:hypothetical protein